MDMHYLNVLQTIDQILIYIAAAGMIINIICWTYMSVLDKLTLIYKSSKYIIWYAVDKEGRARAKQEVDITEKNSYVVEHYPPVDD